jgi:hypothetical protein
VEVEESERFYMGTKRTRRQRVATWRQEFVRIMGLMRSREAGWIRFRARNFGLRLQVAHWISSSFLSELVKKKR